MRLITFNGPRKSATPLYAELSLLKFFDQVKVLNILYVHKYLNGNLPEDCLKTLKFEKTDHSYGTRGNTIGLLNRPNVNSTNYGLNSFSRLSYNQWNELQQNFQDLNLSELKLARLKSLSTNFYLNKYNELG